MRTRRTSRNLAWLAVLVLLALGGAAYRAFATGGGGATAATGSNLRQPTAVTNGLLAWYPLDGDAKDYSGNRYDLALGTGTSYVQGKFGKSIHFNGSSDNSQAPISPALTLSSFTVSAWFSPDSVGSTYTYHGLMASNTFSFIESGTDTSHIVGINVGRQSGYAQCSGYDYAPQGTYRLLTATVTASTITLYVDARSVASCAVNYAWEPLTTVAVGPDLYISNLGATATSGSVDDARLYGRSLSASEIASLSAGSPSQNCDQTCKAWLKFDDDMGTTASDSTGNGNAGTLNGTTTWTTGNFASAISLDGSTGYVSLPNLAMTAGTVDMWINPASVTGDQRLFAQLTGASTQAGQIALNQSSGESGSLWVYDGSAWQRLSADGSIKAGQWNQVVVANNGGTVVAYVNGTQAMAAPATAVFNFSGPTAGIGAKFLGTAGGTFNGSVDDFRIYSRMLAPEEVADQWRQGT